MARRKKGFAGLAQAGAADVNPMWGAVASGGVGTVTAIGLRSTTRLDSHAELIGLGAGVTTGALMMLGERSRAAGFVGIVTALVTQGSRFLEAALSPKQKLKDAHGAAASIQASEGGLSLADQSKLANEMLNALKAAKGLGIVSPERVPTLGAVTAQQVPVLGAASAQQIPTLQGGLGIVSPEVVRSLGSSGAPATFQGGMQGVPGVTIQGAGLSSAYGATLLGGND